MKPEVWIITIPLWAMAVAISVIFIVTTRKRRWRDQARLAKPSAMPPELLDTEPHEVRDMAVGEQRWVSTDNVVVNKKGKAFIDWTAHLEEGPEDQYSARWKVPVRRLQRGFSITVSPEHHFRKRVILWGYYAPVAEIVQAQVKTGAMR
jgi:hypothetical protein